MAPDASQSGRARKRLDMLEELFDLSQTAVRIYVDESERVPDEKGNVAEENYAHTLLVGFLGHTTKYEEIVSVYAASECSQSGTSYKSRVPSTRARFEDVDWMKTAYFSKLTGRSLTSSRSASLRSA